MIDFNVMATFSPGIVMVDYGGALLGKCLDF